MAKSTSKANSPTGWFGSILDAYEISSGKSWASLTHAKQAIEFYAAYCETGDVRFLDECEKYLKVAIPKKDNVWRNTNES